MSLVRRMFAILGVVLACCLLAGAGYGAWYWMGRTQGEARGFDNMEREGGERAIPIKTIRPKLNPKFVRSVTQPADLKAFYRAELMARVPGVVTEDLKKNIGEAVKKGETLMTLDVPDLVAEVEQKNAALKLARKDKQDAEAMV